MNSRERGLGKVGKPGHSLNSPRSRSHNRGGGFLVMRSGAAISWRRRLYLPREVETHFGYHGQLDGS